jgi:hypothetical protein
MPKGFLAYFFPTDRVDTTASAAIFVSAEAEDSINAKSKSVDMCS